MTRQAALLSPAQMFHMLSGFVISQALYVVARPAAADRLIAGSRTVNHLRPRPGRTPTRRAELSATLPAPARRARGPDCSEPLLRPTVLRLRQRVTPAERATESSPGSGASAAAGKCWPAIDCPPAALSRYRRRGRRDACRMPPKSQAAMASCSACRSRSVQPFAQSKKPQSDRVRAVGGAFFKGVPDADILHTCGGATGLGQHLCCGYLAQPYQNGNPLGAACRDE